jgi:hypothetical protein
MVQSDWRLSTCLGSHQGKCLVRAMWLGLEVASALAAAGREPVVADPLVLSFEAEGLTAYDLACRVPLDLPCPNRPPAPHFDGERLYLCDLLIHSFAPQADNEIVLLTAFEEAGWPRSIDDPLHGHEPGFEKTLHNTVYALNRVSAPAGIRFSCDGRARKVHWTRHDKPEC